MEAYVRKIDVPGKYVATLVIEGNHHVFVHRVALVNCGRSDNDGHWCNLPEEDPVHRSADYGVEPDHGVASTDPRQWATEGTEYPYRGESPKRHAYDNVPGQHACMHFDVNRGRCGLSESNPVHSASERPCERSRCVAEARALAREAGIRPLPAVADHNEHEGRP